MILDLYSYQNIILFLARVVLGITFIKHGWPKVKKPFGLKDTFVELKFPAPALFSVIVAAIEFIGGIFIIAGFYTQLVCLLMAADSAVFALIKKFKIKKRWVDPVRSLARAEGTSMKDLSEATSNGVGGYELELTLFFLALLLAMFGAGDWAL